MGGNKLGETPPLYRRSIPLRSSLDCRKALAKLINQSLQGRLAYADLSRLSHSINVLAGLIESSEVVERVERLEERLQGHI